MQESKPNTEKILVVRNDKLGDFILSLPCFAALKSCLPDTEIAALVPAYTAEIAAACPWIDDVLVEARPKNALQQLTQLTRVIRAKRFNAAITLFSTTRVGLALFFAGVPYRLAPATKIAQVFYNKRLKQRRSRSEKPEHAYNLDLVKRYLLDRGMSDVPELNPPYLKFQSDHIQTLRKEFCERHDISTNDDLVFLHAGSGGSANNLSLEQFAALASHLKTSGSQTIVLTSGPGEEERTHALSRLLQGVAHVVYHSTSGLVTFAQHIAFANLFIAGSTGPLHIAGALNVPTAAFYPRRRSATALRWQTLNTADRRLAFSPPEGAEESNMNSIDVNAAAQLISEKFLTGTTQS